MILPNLEPEVRLIGLQVQSSRARITKGVPAFLVASYRDYDLTPDGTHL